MQGLSREGREGVSDSAMTRHWTNLVAKRDLKLKDPDFKHCFANTLSSITETVENEDTKGEQGIRTVGRRRIS